MVPRRARLPALRGGRPKAALGLASTNSSYLSLCLINQAPECIYTTRSDLSRERTTIVT